MLASLGNAIPKDACYQPADLAIGSTINVHGRPFFIYDADQFTKSWMRETLGVGEAQLAAIDVSEPEGQAVARHMPPHNGFGDPLDSLQNCMKLVRFVLGFVWGWGVGGWGPVCACVQGLMVV
jgi:hypothetical protein